MIVKLNDLYRKDAGGRNPKSKLPTCRFLGSLPLHLSEMPTTRQTGLLPSGRPTTSRVRHEYTNAWAPTSCVDPNNARKQCRLEMPRCRICGLRTTGGSASTFVGKIDRQYLGLRVPK